MRIPSGVVLYEGPSLLNGQPIVCIAVGLNKASTNSKTGGMVQTYILCNEESPLAASDNGNDKAICGGCIHRRNPVSGVRSCYVTLMHGPLGVWKAWRKGNYRHCFDFRVFAGLPVRFGTYGDPAAVPTHVWDNLAEQASMTTGYTHQWKNNRVKMKGYCVASCETAEDVIAANARGYGTFRVLPLGSSIPADSIHCPASKENGHSTTCEKCGICTGGKMHNVVIIAHGATAKRYTGSRELVVL